MDQCEYLQKDKDVGWTILQQSPEAWWTLVPLHALPFFLATNPSTIYSTFVVLLGFIQHYSLEQMCGTGFVASTILFPNLPSNQGHCSCASRSHLLKRQVLGIVYVEDLQSFRIQVLASRPLGKDCGSLCFCWKGLEWKSRFGAVH